MTNIAESTNEALPKFTIRHTPGLMQVVECELRTQREAAWFAEHIIVMARRLPEDAA